MRDVFDDKGIGVQAKGSIYESSSDMFPKWKDICTEFGYERVVRHAMVIVLTPTKSDKIFDHKEKLK
jgi:hypothetical protein